MKTLNYDLERPRYSIGAASRRTGLSIHVLRAWERRYGVVRPSRTRGRQRLYTDAELERLRLLRRATEAGRTIGQVAKLSTAELQRLVGEVIMGPVSSERGGDRTAA